MSLRAPNFLICIALLAAMAPLARTQSPSFVAAMKLFQQQRWEEAASAFQAIETSSPGETDALLYKGKSLINLGRFADADPALVAYSAAHPQSDETLYLLAYTHFREGKPEESLNLSTRAAKLRAPEADDLKIVALDYVLLNDLASASRYLQQSLQLKPNNVEARYALGRVLYQQNQFDQAITAFQEVLRIDPRNVKAQDNLGLAWEGKNETEQAIAAYQKAIEMDKAAAHHYEQPFLNLGTLLSKLNRSEAAIPLLTRAIEIDAGSAQAHLELGRAYFNASQMDKAQGELEEAARLQPQKRETHYLLGRLYQRLGKTDQAKDEFKTTEDLIHAEGGNAADVRPREPEPQAASKAGPGTEQKPSPPVQALRSDAAKALRDGELEKSLSILIQARKAAPTDPDVNYEFGTVALRMGLYPDSAEALQQALSLRRDDPNALYALGRAKMGLGKFQDARELFARYVQLRPEDASGHYGLGVILRMSDATTEARQELQRSIDLQPAQTESYVQLGKLELDKGDLEGAAGQFNRVLKRYPRHPEALMGMGEVHFQRKDYAAAASLLRDATAASPALREAHYYLGLAYARLKQPEDSKRELDIASKLEHEELDKQRTLLKLLDPGELDSAQQK
ncbi:MAG: tetratricopeptide repeat protein [Acidobacteriia bacterium]|nr:tetratricopeptide repeat protein [Terriglobia bacterium]